VTDSTVDVLTGTDVPRPAIAALSTMPRVDLMPPELAEREVLRRLQIGCVAAILACAVATGSVWYQAHSTVNDAKANVANAQKTQSQVQRQVNSLASVASAFAAVEQGNKVIQQALGGEVRWSTQLRDLSMTIPSNIWLTSANIAATSSGGSTPQASVGTSQASTGASLGVATITFQGTGSSRYDVAKWLTTISGLKGYTNVTYTTSQEKTLNGLVYVDFTSSATLTSDVLSGRYTNLSGS